MKISLHRIALTGLLVLAARENLPADDFITKTFTASNGKTARYELWIPKAYDKSKAYPLSVWIHGTEQIVPPTALTIAANTSFEMDLNTWLINVPGILPQFPFISAAVMDVDDPNDAQKVIADIESNYNVDQKNIAIRGLPALPLTFTDSNGATIPYELIAPPNYNKSQTYPVVLFFHGAGERGIDGLAQLRNGVMNYSDPAFQAKFPCFVIAPQCPTVQNGQLKQWVDMPWGDLKSTRPPQPSGPMQLALKLLDSVCAQYPIDKNREYVVGISMGGYAVWDSVTRFPDRFAAGIACCGGGDETTVTPEVARVPVWAFASSDDPTVPVVRSRNMVAAMAKAGGHPRYVEYNWLGHVSWWKAWSDTELFPWLFSQRLDQRPPVAK